MRDFLAFRRMIATYFIQVIFWIGVVGLVAVFVGAISNDQAPLGFLVLIFGALYWRILCEVFIVFFRMNDTLTSIKADTAGLPAALAGRGGTPAAGGARTEEPEAMAGPSQSVSTGKSDEPTAAASAAPTATLPPEGWYDDPDRPGRKRWWDGEAWGMRDDEHSSAR